MRDDIEVYVRMSYLPTRQGGAEGTWGLAWALTKCKKAMGHCHNGLYYVIAKFKRLWHDYGIGRSFFRECYLHRHYHQLQSQRGSLFLRDAVKHWGIPKQIISDRDPCFTGTFCRELFNLLGSDCTSQQVSIPNGWPNGEGQYACGAVLKILH